MLRHMKCFVWGFVLLTFFAADLKAQFVYTNNDLAAGNSVSAFSLDLATGSLTELTSLGSPFATGGLGSGSSFYAPNRIIVVGDFLYASNSGSNSITAFTIDPSTGGLTLVGQPVATEGVNSATYAGISLAATPDGKYIYAGTTGDGNITIYSIDSTTGALTPLASGSPFAAGGAMSSMKVTPDGKYLAVALYPLNEVAMFAIQTDGTLQKVSGSPFSSASSAAGYLTGIDVNCASTLLFAGRSGSDIDVFNINSGGTLSELANSPFSTIDPTTNTGPTSNQVVALSTDDSTLFSSNQGNNSVTAFAVGSDGSLSAPEATVGTGTGTLYPGGLAVSKDGGFLFAADTNAAVSAFALGGTSPLSFDSVASTGQTSGLHSLAAYPAKACASSTSTTSLNVTSLQIFGGPPPGFDLEATLSLDSSLVVDPLTQAVTIQVGSFTINLPAGSFKTFQSGTNSGSDVFNGSIDGATLKIQITPLGQNQFQISDYAKQIDLEGLANPVTVMVSIGGNAASTSVDATDPAAIRWHR